MLIGRVVDRTAVGREPDATGETSAGLEAFDWRPAVDVDDLHNQACGGSGALDRSSRYCPSVGCDAGKSREAIVDLLCVAAFQRYPHQPLLPLLQRGV